MFMFSKKPSKKFKMAENRIHYDENSVNGLIIEEKYIPEEILARILCYIDQKSLLACQLVCKHWHFLIQNYIWHKKAELILQKSISIDKKRPWPLYYYMCTKTPFNKNLIKNHSGELGVNTHWIVATTSGNGWSVECPPLGVPSLPHDPVFEGRTYCFVTSHYLNRRADMDHYSCRKYQIINLVEEGFSEHLLDYVQPKIKISEWYSCREDCPAVYACHVQLIGEKKGKEKVIGNHKMTRYLCHENQNIWFRNECEFKNYGKGLRKIKFTHSGQDERSLNGYYGSKMAGACVKVVNPFVKKNKSWFL